MLAFLIKDSLSRFARDDGAAVTVEWVFMFPMLVWAFAGIFSFFDMFRTKNTNMTAAYTISDMLSRNDGNAVDQAYLDGLHTVFDYLVSSPNPTWIRVTSFVWNEDNGLYELHWSHTAESVDIPVTMPVMTQQDLNDVADRIPIMADGDCAFLLETSAVYTPLFSNLPFMSTLAPTQNFNNFIVTQPRFVSELPFNGVGDCLPST